MHINEPPFLKVILLGEFRMGVFEFEGRVPKISPKAYVDEDASVVGDVTIGVQCYIGPGARIRGDYGTVTIGDKTSIQENCVLHARINEKCEVGSHVQIGHGALLHNCVVKDYAVVGVGAVVSDYATVGVWSIVGEGAVVTSGQTVPDGKVAVGIPAKIIRDVTDADKQLWGKYKDAYADLALRYPKGLKRIS
jgi:carbonic anhydrase/acetyltransferase-like protein (isoleucine patch superfamily)